MKYMTFNSSCSYAGLANMLSTFGIDTEDRDIALEMGLPYFFTYEDGAYLAGPSLQNAKWFNLYLNPRGFELDEAFIPKSEVPDYLRSVDTAMLGIRVTTAGKHAVVYTGSDAEAFCFINNKWPHDPSPESFTLSETELIGSVDDPCVVATLHTITPRSVSVEKQLEASCSVLEQYRQELHRICDEPRPIGYLHTLLNPLFRALLLDGITMLALLEENQLVAELSAIQATLLRALRSNASELRLSDHLDMDILDASISRYQAIIQAKL